MLRLLLLPLLLAACSSFPKHHTSAKQPAEKADVQLSANRGRIVYHGPLTRDGVTRVQQLYWEHPDTVTTLEIDSSGGDTTLGMELGSFVHRQRLDVSVPRYCASSCANYVFPAGRYKLLGRDALLMWHGGALQPDWDALIRAKWPNQPQIQQAERQRHAGWQQREREFFAEIGVSQLITVCGQHGKWLKQVPTHGVFDYSPQDLARFGVSNILYDSAGWQPHQQQPDARFYRADYCDTPPPAVDKPLCGCTFGD